jgi:hypothetical protein
MQNKTHLLKTVHLISTQMHSKKRYFIILNTVLNVNLLTKLKQAGLVLFFYKINQFTLTVYLTKLSNS